MFLPDGKVLIMESGLFKLTLEKSIVLDLFEGTSLNSESQQNQENKKEEDKSVRKEKKTSQANQRKKNLGEVGDLMSSSQMDNMISNYVAMPGFGQGSNPMIAPNNPNPSEKEVIVEEKKDFVDMLNQKEFSDITLNVDGKLIYAH